MLYILGDNYIQQYVIDLIRHGYDYTDTFGYSLGGYQSLAENGKYAVLERINEQGWFEATFLQWGQDVKLD